MRVLLGASNFQQLYEARSWVNLLTSAGFRELESLLREREKGWGQAVVFIETVLPRNELPPGRHFQFDLLVSFDTRIAVFEMKGYSRAFPRWIEEAANQLGGSNKWKRGQIDALRAVLRKEGYDDEHGVRAHLFCPNLDLGELQAVHRILLDVHSAAHVLVVGNDPQLRDRCGNYYYYLPEALDHALRDSYLILRPGQKPLSALLENRMRNAGARLLDFPSFKGARDYLREVGPAGANVIWEPRHVPGLFEEPVKRVVTLVKSCGVAEITGPPGSGKSTVAREAIEALGEDHLELTRLRRAASLQDVTVFVSQALEGDPEPGQSAAALLEWVARQSVVFWLRDYEEAIAPVLMEFMDAMRAVPERRACWIVESREGLAVFNDCRCALTPLEPAAISKILEREQSGGYFTDPELVVDRAQGNPRRARTLWRSSTQCQAEAPSTVEWFLRRLSRAEGQMLPILCHALALTPLGASLGMLRLWAAQALPGELPGQRDAVLESLLRQLEREQLAQVSRLCRQPGDRLLEALLPRAFQLTIVDSVAPSLLADIPTAAIERRMDPVHLHLALLEPGQADTLGYVTSALLEGDLEPFFRSSFRATALPSLLDWCARSNWVPANAKQAYLLRALRMLVQMGHTADLNVDRDCGMPDPNEPVQQIVFAVARARLAAYQPAAPGFDLSRAVAEASRAKDADLRVEQLSSLARSLERANRFAESWDILRTLPGCCPPDSPSFFWAHKWILVFLNRRQQRLNAVPDAEAWVCIGRSSEEMVRYAARVENLQAIWEALLYSVRARERAQQGFSDAEIASYGAILELVEKHRSSRTRRLQAQLTHGSLDRHACARQNITWEEFQRHMDTALRRYERAFRSAAAQGHLVHLLNALNYSQELVLKATRFARELSTSNRSNVIDRAIDLLRLTEAHVPAEEGRAFSLQEQELISMTSRNTPLLMYLAAFGESFSADQQAQLRIHWQRLATNAKTRLAQMKAAMNYPEAAKYRQGLATTIRRVRGFGEIHDRNKAQTIRGAICESWEALEKTLEPPPRRAPDYRRPNRL